MNFLLAPELEAFFSFQHKKQLGLAFFSPHYLFTYPILSYIQAPQKALARLEGSIRPILHMGTAAQTHLFKLVKKKQRFQG